MNAIMVAASIKNGSVVVMESNDNFPWLRGMCQGEFFSGADFIEALKNMTAPIHGWIEGEEIKQVEALYGIEYLPTPVTAIDTLVSIGVCKYPTADERYMPIDEEYLFQTVCNNDYGSDIDYAYVDSETDTIIGFDFSNNSYSIPLECLMAR